MMIDMDKVEPVENLDIAIIGMAGRFPGANNVTEFWRNLRDGVESIRQFTDEELKNFGVSSESLEDPNFVKAGAILDDIDKFDAAIFGYSPRDAEIIDPQQRIFLECAWQAMEDAGYCSNSSQNLVGVFAGASLSTYLLYNLLQNEVASDDAFQAMIGNDKDFLCTRVSYELNLKGPSIDIQTACSTSLVAVHIACQNLLSYQCDMALAGGVSAQVPQRTGYFYIPAGISSPDGHCRAFDAEARGTVFGSGVGVVALKRLADALSDRDMIHAVIKGSALGNDGSSKIGYTAPSVEGQAQVIALAQLVAGVKAETITYVETHGTGTPLGDPAEIAALTRAFRASTDRNNFCAVGSVKTNIGHLDAAAGVAGLIKTVLALKHKQLPPSLYFERPNPQIDFPNSPFYVNSRLKEWDGGGSRLRAGVSSFGVGGTNAHVILEQAPERESGGPPREYKLITLSAGSSKALETASRELARHLQEHEQEDFADVTYSLQVGRRRMSHRRVAVCRDNRAAARLLESNDPQGVLTAYEEAEGRSVVFMFPGGGTQYVNMGLGLYQAEEVFRREVDLCCDILNPEIGYDLRDFLYPGQANPDEARCQMRRPSVGLPALFIVEYAMARLLERWGIKADAMIGHSLGEYVAACLSDVFSLEDALKIVGLRGKLFEELPQGGMVSVGAGEQRVRALIGDELSIAAVNGPEQVVVSGREEAIQELCRRLTGAEIEHRRVQIEVAAHSWMVEAILDKYDECVSRVRKQAPSKRYISNVSGKWITPEEATDAGYWRRQLRECVRFSDGVKELAAAGAEVIVEVGPGQTLRSLVKTQEIGKQIDWVVGTLRRPQEEQDDREYLIGAVGKLWMAGVEIDWGQYYEGEKRRRVGLPTYPFDRQRYWIEAGRSVEQSRRRKSSAKRQKVSEWFYLPEWRRKDLRRGGEQAAKGEGQRTNGKHYLVMEGSSSLSRGVVEGLNRNAAAVIRVKAGEIYRKIGALEYEIRAEEKTDYQKLLKALVDAGIEIEEVVHLWSIEDEEESQKEVNDEERFKSGQQKGFYSLLYMAQAIEACELTGVIQVSFVSRGLQDVESGDVVAIEQATALGACKVIAQECEKLNCRSIDVGEAPAGRQATRLVEALIDEIEHEGAGQEVAYRGRRRFVKSYEALRVEKKMPDLGLKEGGVYLITGGTGGIGVEVAEHLCKQRQGRVALVSRKGLAGVEAAIARRIERMEEKVMVARADVANEAEMRRAVAEVEQKFGRIDGVIHMAGLAGEKAVKIIPDVTHKDCEMHFNAKVYGLYVLDRILRDCRPDFCLLFSSNASILGGIGSICYSAANIFMDAFAFKRNRHSDTRWISANWDGWLLNESNRLSASFQTSLDQYAMTRDESIEALEYLLAPEMEGQVIVSTGDLMSRLAIWTRPKTNKTSDAGIDAAAFLSMHSRPSLGVEYTPASNEIEQVIINVWQEVLGIDRLGARDNFFDLGGNSLTGLKVISRLKKELKIDIPVVALFEGPTASDLARVISKGDAQGPADQESRVRGERRRERIRFKHSASDEIETADLS